MQRKQKIITGDIYHIISKSIAGYKIFCKEYEFLRMRQRLQYYQVEKMPVGFSQFFELAKVQRDGFFHSLAEGHQNRQPIVKIIAYCLMPTHIHLVLKQLRENGISIFMGNVLNSYTRYFNIRYKRIGPLWAGRFKNIPVKSDEQLLHLTRYIHLNPVTSHLVEKPEDWKASSYLDYVSNDTKNKLCQFEDLLSMDPLTYRKFVADRIGYQRELAKIKQLIEEDAPPTSTAGVEVWED